MPVYVVWPLLLACATDLPLGSSLDVFAIPTSDCCAVPPIAARDTSAFPASAARTSTGEIERLTGRDDPVDGTLATGLCLAALRVTCWQQRPAAAGHKQTCAERGRAVTTSMPRLVGGKGRKGGQTDQRPQARLGRRPCAFGSAGVHWFGSRSLRMRQSQRSPVDQDGFGFADAMHVQSTRCATHGASRVHCMLKGALSSQRHASTAAGDTPSPPARPAVAENGRPSQALSHFRPAMRPTVWVLE